MEPMHPGDRTYRNQTIRLADLTVVNDVIEGMTFENCNIVGPAVVAFVGSGTVQNCGFDGDPDSLFWDTADRGYIIGAVGIKDCRIFGCRFQRIGVAVKPQDRDMFLQGLNFDPPGG